MQSAAANPSTTTMASIRKFQGKIMTANIVPRTMDGITRVPSKKVFRHCNCVSTPLFLMHVEAAANTLTTVVSNCVQLQHSLTYLHTQTHTHTLTNTYAFVKCICICACTDNDYDNPAEYIFVSLITPKFKLSLRSASS